MVCTYHWRWNRQILQRTIPDFRIEEASITGEAMICIHRISNDHETENVPSMECTKHSIWESA